MQNEFKVCCRCKVKKTLEKFNKCSLAKDGLNYSCKTCVCEKHQLYRNKKLGKETVVDEVPVAEKKFVDYLPEKLKWKIKIQLINAARGYANNKRNH